MSIRFPKNNFPGEVENFETNRLVLIGANGSGKTRLGIWIEEQNHHLITVHRISAQKALSIPDYAPLMNAGQAEKHLMFGRTDQHAQYQNKRNARWGNEPATFLLSDFVS